MSGYTELLKFLKQQQSELGLQRLLEAKGYVNSHNDDFGLNQWTSRLITRRSVTQAETHQPEIEQPDHLVSFLSIPADFQEEYLDTNSEELQHWLSGYKWQNIPGVESPFPQRRYRACSEGLILPQWLETSNEDWLEAFLLISRDGICEYGIGGKAYFLYEKNTIFQLLHIVGQLWQFLIFVKTFHELFLPNKLPENLIFVNIRGTENALMGNLAEGWNEPLLQTIEPYRPKCIDKHLQFHRKISLAFSDFDVQDIVHWFATRIDNAWGQFEPRCYVSQ
jgi:hypothetical protein